MGRWNCHIEHQNVWAQHKIFERKHKVFERNIKCLSANIKCLSANIKCLSRLQKCLSATRKCWWANQNVLGRYTNFSQVQNLNIKSRRIFYPLGQAYSRAVEPSLSPVIHVLFQHVKIKLSAKPISVRDLEKTSYSLTGPSWVLSIAWRDGEMDSR